MPVARSRPGFSVRARPYQNVSTETTMVTRRARVNSTLNSRNPAADGSHCIRGCDGVNSTLNSRQTAVTADGGVTV